jgi:hypothetical protein
VRCGAVFAGGLGDEVQQNLAAVFQVIGFAVVGTLAFLAEPLVPAFFHHHRRAYRQVVVLLGQLILDAEQVLFVTAIAVEENHQRQIARIGVGLLQVLERQIGLQRGLGVDGGGRQECQQSEKLQHKPSFTGALFLDDDFNKKEKIINLKWVENNLTLNLGMT